jgi:phage gpG-like protein
MKRAGEDLGQLSDAHAETAAYVAGAANAAAPRRSGTLAATVRGNRAKTSAVIKAGGAAVPYAGVIHWGWPRHNITANPFMTDTAKSTEPAWTEIYLRAITRIVDRIHGK